MYNKTEQEIMQDWKGDISKPKVSVCCITFMHENYISQALDSFLMQETNFPFEIIVRDDGSSDKTAEIVKQYQKKYSKIIKPILEPENTYSKGIRATPVVFKKAIGEYIALCEGDDYWIDSSKLQKQFDMLEANKDIKGVHTKTLYIDKSGKEIGLSDRVKKGFETVDYRYLAQQNTIHTPSFMFSKEIIDDDLFELINNAPVGDLVIFLKTSLHGKIAYINKVMSAYRRGSGLTNDWNRDKTHLNILKIYDLFDVKYNKVKTITNISRHFYYFKLTQIYIEQYKLKKAFTYYVKLIATLRFRLFPSYKIVNEVKKIVYVKFLVKLLIGVFYAKNK